MVVQDLKKNSPWNSKPAKKTILVGDKVLIAPDADRTNHGLYLPPGVKEKGKVQSGTVEHTFKRKEKRRAVHFT